MKYLLLVLCSFVLTACVGDRSDLELFITMVRAQRIAQIPPLQEPPKFEHFAYQADVMRSPFVPPSRELTEEVIDTTKDCLQPDLNRHKSPLETYALDNLKMRGTLTEDSTSWALIETHDINVYRVGVGEYLGLFNGIVTKVTPQYVEVVELIPDGSGCWSERINSLALSGK